MQGPELSDLLMIDSEGRLLVFVSEYGIPVEVRSVGLKQGQVAWTYDRLEHWANCPGCPLCKK